MDSLLESLASAEIFDPVHSTVTLLPDVFNEARGAHSAVLLNQRWVLLAGGSERFGGGLSSQENLNGKSLHSTEVFDTTQNKFAITSSLKISRGFHQSCVAQNDGNGRRVFFTPGMGVGGASSSVECMDWADLSDLSE